MKKILAMLIMLFCTITIFSGCSTFELNSSQSSGGKEYYINENIDIDGVNYKVYDIDFCDSIPGTLGGDIKADYTFVYIKIRIKNNTKTSENFNHSMFTLYAPNGMQYEAKDYLYMYNRMDYYDLDPGFEKDFYLVYEIPEQQVGTYKLERFFWTKDSLIINLTNK